MLAELSLRFVNVQLLAGFEAIAWRPQAGTVCADQSARSGPVAKTN
jgi:hypothetical protein